MVEKASKNDVAESAQTLLQRYLEICNDALKKHGDKLPYKEIVSAVKRTIDDHPLELAVYDDKPKAAFTLSLKEEKLVSNGYPEDVKKAWRMDLSYLRQVVEQPKEYIENPEKLDLDWLKSRLDIL